MRHQWYQAAKIVVGVTFLLFIALSIVYDGGATTAIEHHIGENLRNVLMMVGGCPEEAMITADHRGRLGNNILEYATIYGLATKFGLRAVATDQLIRSMKYYFSNMSLPVIPSFCTTGFTKIQTEAFEKLDVSEMSNKSYLIDRYPHRVSIFLKYRERLLEEFKLKREFTRYAEETLRRVADGMPNRTFIGVHVRRGDYARHLKVVFNGVPANATFYNAALNFSRQRYTNPLFIVTSDDLEWCRRELEGQDVHVIGDTRGDFPGPGLDLALLANCNHTVFDYGTFGFVGAFLAGGDIITLDGNSEREHELVSEMRLAEMKPTYLDLAGNVLPKCRRCL